MAMACGVGYILCRCWLPNLTKCVENSQQVGETIGMINRMIVYVYHLMLELCVIRVNRLFIKESLNVFMYVWGLTVCGMYKIKRKVNEEMENL